ncbi:MAG: ABC transporter substrate-binding protein [Deltaproteobacteria bacterium]|nr:ABC transporter substrate-binding protein [Deltaproteobacteria bacterium]
MQRPVRLNVFRVDAAVVAAQARGFFASEGIELKITHTPNSTEQMRGISKGAFELASTAFDNVLAWSGKEGAEIVAVAQTTDKILLPVFVRPEIRDWSQLKGKKLAVDAVDTAFALVLRRILLSHGLDLNRKDYELVPAGATGHRLDSMTRGETFAAILNAPFDAKAEAAGLVRFADHLEVLPHYPGGVYAVNRSWAKSNRETLVAFLRAWLAAGRWVRDPANREEAVNLVAADLKLSPRAAAGSVEDLSATGSLNIPGLESVLGLRTQFGFTPPMGPAVGSYYDLDYYRASARK